MIVSNESSQVSGLESALEATKLIQGAYSKILELYMDHSKMISAAIDAVRTNPEAFDEGYWLSGTGASEVVEYTKQRMIASLDLLYQAIIALELYGYDCVLNLPQADETLLARLAESIVDKHVTLKIVDRHSTAHYPLSW